jgi:hypothetical protein
MKHHFADMLDRDGDYWTVVPNRERYLYSIEDVPSGSSEIVTATIGKETPRWEVMWSLPNLEEVTLHEPSIEQLLRISELTKIRRLRITHARPKNIEFLSTLRNIEELVLEYVSGFSDLSPLRGLKRLKSLHIENVRRVSDFGGLSGIASLRYLSIRGTLDWKQPISNFEFLKGLQNLEVLSFWQVTNQTTYPALLPALELKKLKRIHAVWDTFPTSEFALLSEIFRGVEGADWGPYRRWANSTIPLPSDDIRFHLPDELIRKNHPEVIINFKGEKFLLNPDDEWFEFTGRKAGRVKCQSPQSGKRCEEFAARFEAMREDARHLIATLKV